MNNARLIGWTLCSGIGAPEMAAPGIDWRLASEIEPFPRAVLQDRFGYKLPEDHNQGDPLLWGDMTEVTPDLARAHGVPLPDLLVAGTPCQAFSIAGLRGGTEDARGNLTLKFVETCHAIVNARPDGKLIVLWENVPGVLSDKGNAFGCFLGGLVGAVDALQSPGDGSWPGEGMVQGPRARAAWCILDAQWFGVAQRRRRVFVVVDFGGACDPAQILLEPDSLRGDSPTREKARQETASTVAASVGGVSGKDDPQGKLVGWEGEKDGVGKSHWNGGPHPALNQSHNTGGIGSSNQEIFSQGGSGLVPDRNWPADVAPTLNAHFGDKMGLGNQHALNGAGLFVPVAFDCKGTEVQNDDSGVSPPLRSMGHLQSHQNAGGHAAVAIGGQIAHTLTGEGHDATEDSSGRGTPVVAFAQNTRDEVRFQNGDGSISGALSAEPGMKQQTYLASGPVVRRLTPTECARLQGFPDDHCAVTYRGKPAADGNQYKAYGNSMAVPVIRYILERIGRTT